MSLHYIYSEQCIIFWGTSKNPRNFPSYFRGCLRILEKSLKILLVPCLKLWEFFEGHPKKPQTFWLPSASSGPRNFEISDDSLENPWKSMPSFSRVESTIDQPTSITTSKDELYIATFYHFSFVAQWNVFSNFQSTKTWCLDRIFVPRDAFVKRVCGSALKLRSKFSKTDIINF